MPSRLAVLMVFLLEPWALPLHHERGCTCLKSRFTTRGDAIERYIQFPKSRYAVFVSFFTSNLSYILTIQLRHVNQTLTMHPVADLTEFVLHIYLIQLENYKLLLSQVHSLELPISRDNSSHSPSSIAADALSTGQKPPGAHRWT